METLTIRRPPELMARFYRGMLREKKTPASALRGAQMECHCEEAVAVAYYGLLSLARPMAVSFTPYLGTMWSAMWHHVGFSR